MAPFLFPDYKEMVNINYKYSKDTFLVIQEINTWQIC